jgi:ribosomal protein S18 acetylase RimI-like enzyme
MHHDESDRLHQGLIQGFADFLGRVEDAWLKVRPGYRVVGCPRIPFPGLNGIWIDGPDEAIRPGDLEQAINELEGQGLPRWIELRGDRTLASAEVARRFGFTHEESLPGMVVRPDELKMSSGPDIKIARVDDSAGLAAAATVAAEGFEVPLEHLTAMFTPLVAATPGISVYVARADGRAVSTVTTWAGDGTVGIFNVATPPAERGRGYGRAITAHAVHEGFEAGADLAWLQASPLGEPVYRALGFRQVETYLVLGRPATA